MKLWKVFENFIFFLRFRPKCEAMWNILRTLKFITNCKVSPGFDIASDVGI